MKVMSNRILMKGNKPLLKLQYEVAVDITLDILSSTNEITEYMSREMIKVGGSFVQAESGGCY